MSTIENEIRKSAILLKEQSLSSLKDNDIGNNSASLDARILMEFVYDVSHEQLLFIKNNPIENDKLQQYHSCIKRRLAKEPIAKIIGKKPFWKYDFYTSKHTLDPRPDSESLIELVLENIPHHIEGKIRKSYRILDLGTGTGCLLLTLLAEIPNITGINAVGVGVDISSEALEIAQKNAIKIFTEIAMEIAKIPETENTEKLQCNNHINDNNDLEMQNAFLQNACIQNVFLNNISFIKSNWGEQLVGIQFDNKFDIIISNPPYIAASDMELLDDDVKYDPISALVSGDDGYDDYRKIAPYIKELLTDDGFAVFEIGKRQENKVETIMAQHGINLVDSKKDLSSIIRALMFKI